MGVEVGIMFSSRKLIGAALIPLFFLALRPGQVQALPAFPGAQGWGANALGGRGGAVIQVTNLSDSGPGSLRACVAAKDPRTCVFRTGGTITLNTRLDINNPFLTIAGQTAPGGGIQIKGHAILVNSPAHNIIIRYIRHRRGLGADGKGMQVYGGTPGAKDVIIDHCSFGWQGDDNDVWGGTSGKVDRVTLQWNIYAEASKGFLSGAPNGGGARLGTLSLHHNYLVGNFARNPLIGGDGQTELVNNVIYNWQAFATNLSNRSSSGSKVNIIGNFWKLGPKSSGSRYEFLVNDGTKSPDQPPGLLYVLDNLGPHRTLSTQPQFAFVGFYGSGTSPAPANLQRSAPWPLSPNPIAVSAANTNVDKVLNNVGAILPSRDSVDNRLVNEYRTGTGVGFGGPLVGKHPVLAVGTPPIDTDRDGMPDSWENSHGLNPNNAADRNAIDASGYTELEVFLNSTGAQAPPPDPDQNQNPVVNVTAPADGSTVSGSAVTVSAAATDDVAVLGVQFKLDGNNLGAEDTSSPYSISWNSTLASEGAHTIKAVARDASISTTSPSIGVTVDNIVSTGPDPLSHYKFDETSGTTAFDFINAQSNDLSLVGGASFVAGGQLGRAISLDGINGHAVDTSTTALNLSSAITVTAWLKPTAFPAGSSSMLMAKGAVSTRGFAVNMLDGKLTFRKIGVVGLQSTVAVPVGTFHHVAVTWDQPAQQVKFYLDGTLAQTINDSAAIFAPIDSDKLTVGTFLSGSEFYTGLIDDLRIYGRVLTDGEIAGMSVDNTPPSSVVITNPANGATVGGNVLLSATATDNIGIAGVQFRLDGANVQAEDTTSPYSITFSTDTIADGTHQLTAVARDAAGNTTTNSISINVTHADICP